MKEADCSSDPNNICSRTTLWNNQLGKISECLCRYKLKAAEKEVSYLITGMSLTEKRMTNICP